MQGQEKCSDLNRFISA